MNIIIDTGEFFDAAPLAAKDFIPDWARDQCPADYADWQVVQSYCHHIMGDMKRPKKIETVIGHMLFNWRFLGALGRENPGLFQEVWLQFAERVDGQ